MVLIHPSSIVFLCEVTEYPIVRSWRGFYVLHSRSHWLRVWIKVPRCGKKSLEFFHDIGQFWQCFHQRQFEQILFVADFKPNDTKVYSLEEFGSHPGTLLNQLNCWLVAAGISRVSSLRSPRRLGHMTETTVGRLEISLSPGSWLPHGCGCRWPPILHYHTSQSQYRASWLHLSIKYLDFVPSDVTVDGGMYGHQRSNCSGLVNILWFVYIRTVLISYVLIGIKNDSWSPSFSVHMSLAYFSKSIYQNVVPVVKASQ